MARVLLINPSYQSSYGGTKASIVNPRFAWQRFYRAITTGQLLNEIYYAIQFFTHPVVDRTESIYYGKDRWPVYDFKSNPPQKLPYLEVKASKKEVKVSKKEVDASKQVA